MLKEKAMKRESRFRKMRRNRDVKNVPAFKARVARDSQRELRRIDKLER